MYLNFNTLYLLFIERRAFDHFTSKLYYYMKTKLVLLLVLFTLLLLNSSKAADLNDIPASLQAAIIKRIMVADPIIKAKTDGIVLIVHDASTADKALIIQKGFASQSIKTEITENPESFSNQTIAAIYYLSDTITRPSYILDHGVLTIAQDDQNVIAGKTALAIRVAEDGKPEIVLNKSVMEIEGHALLIKALPKAVVY